MKRRDFTLFLPAVTGLFLSYPIMRYAIVMGRELIGCDIRHRAELTNVSHFRGRVRVCIFKMAEDCQWNIPCNYAFNHFFSGDRPRVSEVEKRGVAGRNYGSMFICNSVPFQFGTFFVSDRNMSIFPNIYRWGFTVIAEMSSTHHLPLIVSYRNDCWGAGHKNSVADKQYVRSLLGPKLSLRVLQCGVREIVGSMGLTGIKPKTAESKQFNPKFGFFRLRSETLQKCLGGLLVLLSVVLLAFGLVAIHSAPHSEWYGLLGLVLILSAWLILYHWYDMFGL